MGSSLGHSSSWIFFPKIVWLAMPVKVIYYRWFFYKIFRERSFRDNTQYLLKILFYSIFGPWMPIAKSDQPSLLRALVESEMRRGVVKVRSHRFFHAKFKMKVVIQNTQSFDNWCYYVLGSNTLHMHQPTANRDLQVETIHVTVFGTEP
jgi:hypothetical protein